MSGNLHKQFCSAIKSEFGGSCFQNFLLESVADNSIRNLFLLYALKSICASALSILNSCFLKPSQLFLSPEGTSHREGGRGKGEL